MKLHFTLRIIIREGDGQTKRTNQTLEQYIQVLFQLPAGQLVRPPSTGQVCIINNTPSADPRESPRSSPTRGYHPNLTVHPELDLASSRAHEFVTDLDELHHHLRENMAAAATPIPGAWPMPASTRAPAFPIGSQAYVKVQFFRTTRPSKKLADKFLGALRGSLRSWAPTRSTLRLLDSLRAVHPVFHVSMLEPVTPNAIPDRVQPPPPPGYVDDEPEFEIAEVLDSKVDNRSS